MRLLGTARPARRVRKDRARDYKARARAYKAFSASLAFACLAVLSSCATSPYAFRSSPLAALGSEAGAYLIVPVAANRALLEAASRNSGQSISPSALDRARVVYASWSRDTGDSGESGESGSSTRILAVGSFPKRFATLAFPSSKGWVRVTDDAGSKWYQKEGWGAAIPRNGLFASSADMPSFLADIERESGDVTDFPPQLVDYLNESEKDGRVAILVRDASIFTSLFAGNKPAGNNADDGAAADGETVGGAATGGGLLLPIEEALVFAAPRADSYELTLHLEAGDARRSRALAALARLAFGARSQSGSIGVSTEGSRVTVSGLVLSVEALAEFARF